MAVRQGFHHGPEMPLARKDDLLGDGEVFWTVHRLSLIAEVANGFENRTHVTGAIIEQSNHPKMGKRGNGEMEERLSVTRNFTLTLYPLSFSLCPCPPFPLFQSSPLVLGS